MSQMRAVVLESANGLDGLKFTRIEMPRPGPDEVLVNIKAAAMNYSDVAMLDGKLTPDHWPVVPGSDGAGTICDVGENIDDKWLGHDVIINPAINWGEDPIAQQNNFRVLGLPDNGTFAEFSVVPFANIMAKPEHLSYEAAASIPVSGLTGYRALFTQGGLISGETVLITGIGGGVAGLMLKMANACGARVIVTSGSDAKIASALELRAEAGVNYHDENWPEKVREVAGPEGIDLIVDSAGGTSFNNLISIVNRGGRIVFYGAMNGNPGDIDLKELYEKQITLQGTNMGNEQDFDHMTKLIRKYTIEPIIDHAYPIKSYKKAYKRMMDDKRCGKIVLTLE